MRGEEPEELRQVRGARVPILKALGRAPSSDEITGYQVVAEHLWRVQRYKCCYCEHKIKKGFHDVEHYRPKARADRSPGCPETHGYWWLAYSWSNLLFACPACNRSGKNDRFPIAVGGTPLRPGDDAPGEETPLLIDPAGEVNPVSFIKFVRSSMAAGGPSLWFARPRTNDPRAAITIDVLKLNSQELLELRTDYVETILEPFLAALQSSVAAHDSASLETAFARALCLLGRGLPYVGLTYDVLRTTVSDAALNSALGRSWPAPALVGAQ